MVTQVGALGKHLALVGFMGAGKTTTGREVARLTSRPFVDLDEEIERRHGPIPVLFADGEPGFRRLEEETAAEVLARDEPAVVALGGGAVGRDATRERLTRRAFTVWLEVAVEEAWARVGRGERPLAQDEAEFRRLFDERTAVYALVADAAAKGVEGVLLASLAVRVERGLLARLPDLVADASVVVADERVLDFQRPSLDADVLRVPSGERAKTVAVAERLWRELRVEREGVIVAFGGGSTTDLTGFVAATYLRGVRWVAVPTTLVGQVDAAIGGKAGIDLPQGKNLVGAFHFPETVASDPDVLATLPERERRHGMAEVVKPGLLAGRGLWHLREEEMIRACAACKAAVVISDRLERGRRAVLNLGHTFAHALEAASGYTVSHGDAVALGLLAALRLSDQPTDVVEEVLAPQPVRVDRERAWAALTRDKKAGGGHTRLVLLRALGDPVHGVELPDDRVRAELDRLLAD